MAQFVEYLKYKVNGREFDSRSNPSFSRTFVYEYIRYLLFDRPSSTVNVALITLSFVFGRIVISLLIFSIVSCITVLCT